MWTNLTEFWHKNEFKKHCMAISRLPTNWKFRKFWNFYIPLKHFPTTLLLSSLRRAKTATKTKMASSRSLQCLGSGFISPNAQRRDLSDSVKFFKIKETAFQKLACSIWFSSKISGISVKWKAPQECNFKMIFVMAGGSGKSKQQNPIWRRNLDKYF
jgi:hypothetical protein